MPVAELRVPKPLWDLMQFCESFCVSACCHEQAFDLSREQVQRWAELVGEDEFTFARKQLRHFIKKVAYATKIHSSIGWQNGVRSSMSSNRLRQVLI
jgi:hypothetical protein